jgi:hypothetical protein
VAGRIDYRAFQQRDFPWDFPLGATSHAATSAVLKDRTPRVILSCWPSHYGCAGLMAFSDLLAVPGIAFLPVVIVGLLLPLWLDIRDSLVLSFLRPKACCLSRFLRATLHCRAVGHGHAKGGWLSSKESATAPLPGFCHALFRDGDGGGARQYYPYGSGPPSPFSIRSEIWRNDSLPAERGQLRQFDFQRPTDFRCAVMEPCTAGFPGQRLALHRNIPVDL